MPHSQFEIVRLKSGVNSLRLISNNETFHPGIGPIAEANILHVNQHRFEERIPAHEPFILWDVGLGAAANAVAALDRLQTLGGKVEIHSFDKTLAALEFALAEKEELDYIKPYERVISELVQKGETQVGPNIRWILHLGDFQETMHRAIPSPHSIFYDPYSPRGNVEMWNLNHFQKLRQRLDPNRPCLISNYSRATYVRVTWLLAGFCVGIGTAIGEKEETSLAATHPEVLASPLPPSWLRRVQVSHSSAPLRGPLYELGKINEADYKALSACPQFVL